MSKLRATKGVRRRYKAWKSKYNNFEKKLRSLAKQTNAVRTQQKIYENRLRKLDERYVLG